MAKLRNSICFLALLFLLSVNVISPTVMVGANSAELTGSPSVNIPHTATIHFIDVGQGAASLLVGPDFTVLIDAGRHDHDEVVPYLQSVGITSIDLLIGTHPHADHIGQFPQVLAAFSVTEVWMSGDVHSTQAFERALDAILASDAGYYEPRTGDVELVGSLRLEVLNPNSLSGDFHSDSIVVRAVFGNIAILFPGDCEADTERVMIERQLNLNAQILELGHHGSYTSSSLAFLEAVDPQVVIYSAGLNNPYGHPHPEVIERLGSLNIPVYGTDQQGTIRVITDGVSFQVYGSRSETSLLSVSDQSLITIEPVPTLVSTPQDATSGGCQEGQIDINTASLEELDRIKHIGPVRAAEMIELRLFSSVDDMIRINGIGPQRLAAIKRQGLACVAE